MKRLIGGALLALALLVVTLQAKADGMVNADGYAYSGGYFWYGNVAYTRSVSYYWVPGYYTYSSCRCYKYWNPGYYQGYFSYTVARLNSEELVVKALADRMQTQNAMAKEQQRHSNVLELVKVAGLEQNFAYSGYFGGRLSTPYSPVQGSTLYGYTYQQAEAYGKTNLDLLHQLQFQQAALQSQGAQTATSQANDGAILSIADAGRVAITNARMRAAVETFRATEPPGQLKIENKSGVVGPEPLHMPKLDFLKLSGPALCVECHTGDKAKKGFQIDKLPSMSAEEIVKKVLVRLVSDDDKFRMPPAPANRLTADQVRQFMGGQ